jgi:hypothetical protein
MSTIDFIKKNSSNFVEQELWEEEIINKNYLFKSPCDHLKLYLLNIKKGIMAK